MSVIFQAVINVFKKLTKVTKCPFCGYEQKIKNKDQEVICVNCKQKFKVKKG
ncbi:MAG: hypothetical protein PWR24_925 [Desulfonauticus sp.]|jgi:transcription elongation factor Elf1|nr:MAG: hypothetical protein XD41_0047 [Desulfonauticus sp. 38_4375]MDK2921368.1 hypothetical protein [Desulfonauticus sp.]